MAGAKHDAGVVPVEERPIGAVDPDDLVRFNAVPEAQPPLLRQDRGRAAAHAGRRDRRRVRTDAGLAIRLPVKPVGRGREVARRTGPPFASWRIGEVKLAKRPGLRRVMSSDKARAGKEWGDPDEFRGCRYQ